MEIIGTVRNIADFGAFVDIGLKNNGLIHVSNFATKKITDIFEHVAVGDVVNTR